MFIDRALTNTEFLGKALQASTYKSQVINANIANADTPGYRRKIVNFDQSMQDAVDVYRNTGVVDLANVNPITIEDNFTYRIDGNGVVMEQEMIDLYENSTRYDTMINSVNSNFQGIRTALGKQ